MRRCFRERAFHRGLRGAWAFAMLGCLVACPSRPTELGMPGDHAPDSPTVSEGRSAVAIADSASSPGLTRHDIEADDGHTLAMWGKGPTTLETRGVIVLLHGRTWSGIPDFDLQVPGERLSLMDALGSAGYRTYALDLRGYGGSERDASGWIDPDRAAKDLTAALRWVSEREATVPVVFGWSQGALVSHLAVQRAPDLAAALVLYGYPGRVRHGIAEREPPHEPPRESTTAEAAASDFITPGSISPEAVAVYVESCLAADPVRADWRDTHRFNELDPAKITVPTLVIHGEHDPIALDEDQAWLFANLGHGDKRWVVLPDSDHAAHLERPEAFVAAVRGFLERPR